MARKRTEIADQATDSAIDKRKRKRLSIYLNEDGSPDLESVSPELKTALGLGSDQAETEPDQAETIDPGVITFVLMTAARIEAFVVAKQTGLEADVVMRAIVPPEQLMQPMAESGARLLAKYAGGVNRWKDEIVFGSLLLTWQSGVVSTIRALKANQVEPPANAPQAPPPPPDQAQPSGPFPDALPFQGPDTGKAQAPPPPSPVEFDFGAE